MNFVINAKQLRKALKDIEKAEKRGFKYCLSVFTLAKVGPMLSDTEAKYSDMLEKAHPTDGRFDWGRFQGVSDTHIFKNGKLIKKV